MELQVDNIRDSMRLSVSTLLGLSVPASMRLSVAASMRLSVAASMRLSVGDTGWPEATINVGAAVPR